MDLSHGKYLGVDYGDVRTGLAECDVSGLLAGTRSNLKVRSPAGTLQSTSS